MLSKNRSVCIFLSELTTANVLSEPKEYTRESVQVHPLGPFKDVSTHTIDEDDLVPSHPPPLPSSSRASPAIDAQTYVYIDAGDLDSELWSFDDFVKNNAWKWYTGTR
jgi:hypothetical protein